MTAKRKSLPTKETIEILKEIQKTLIKLNDLIEILIHPMITIKEL